MAKLLKILLGVVSALLLLLLAAVVVLPLLFDPNDYRDQLAQAVKKQTGRAFTVGEIKLAVFPWLRVELSDVQLGNAQGFGPEPMLTAQRAGLGVRLWPLLREKRVEASALSLDTAAVALAVDAEGRNNWQDLVPPEDPVNAAPEPPLAERLRTLDIGGITLKDSSLRYRDARSGQAIALDALQLTTGRLYQGKPFPVEASMKAEVAQPAQDAIPASTSRATLALETEVTLDPSGDVQLGALRVQLDGEQASAATVAAKLAVQTESLRYAAAGQTVKTAPLTVEVQQFSMTGPGQPALNAKGQLSAALDYALASGDAEISQPQLQLDVSRAGAEPLQASFALSSERIGFAKTSQQLSAEPLRLQLKQLLIGAAAQPKLSAQGNINTSLKTDLAQQQHTLAGLKADLQLAGSLLPGGKPQTLQLATTLIADLAQQQLRLSPVQLAGFGLKVDAQQWRVSGLSGEVPQLEGDLAIAAFNPRTLLASLGIEAPKTADPKAFTAASLNTQLTASAQRLALDKLVLKLDDTTLRGTLNVRDVAKKAVAFALSADRLNADRYLAPAEKPAVGATATPAAKADMNATELPFDALRQLNVQGTLEVAAFQLKNLKLSNARVKLDGTPGGTQRQQIAANLYGGSIDYASSVAAGDKIGVQLKLNGINAAPLLKDFIDSDKLSGKATMALDVTSTGRTLGAVRKALNGNLSFTVTDGAVKGFNLGKVLRDGQALLTQQVQSASAAPSTDFAELRGAGVIVNGVLKSDQLTAKNPLLRLEGAGEIDLVKETINYLAKPTLVNTASGQGGKERADLRGIVVPIRLTGDLYKPKVAIDWKAALQQQAVGELREKLGVSEETVREKREELRSKAKEELGKGLLKLLGGSKPAAAPPADPAPAPVPGSE